MTGTSSPHLASVEDAENDDSLFVRNASYSEQTDARRQPEAPMASVPFPKDPAGQTDVDSMLLARPTFASRPKKQAGGYEYGPAVKVTAANFTTMVRKVAPIQSS